jgi:hypothetical protein
VAGEGEQLWFFGTLTIIRVPGEAVEGHFSITEFLFRHTPLRRWDRRVEP